MNNYLMNTFYFPGGYMPNAGGNPNANIPQAPNGMQMSPAQMQLMRQQQQQQQQQSVVGNQQNMMMSGGGGVQQPPSVMQQMLQQTHHSTGQMQMTQMQMSSMQQTQQIQNQFGQQASTTSTSHQQMIQMGGNAAPNTVVPSSINQTINHVVANSNDLGLEFLDSLPIGDASNFSAQDLLNSLDNENFNIQDILQ